MCIAVYTTSRRILNQVAFGRNYDNAILHVKSHGMATYEQHG